MPAYFVQYIAYCMHGGFPIWKYDVTDIKFALTPLSSRYINQRTCIKERSDFIKAPHYLETYYLVTKKISIIDFN